MPGVSDVEIDLTNLDSSIFKAVQQCIQVSSIGNKGDKIRRIWEPTYVIVYKEVKEKSPTGNFRKNQSVFERKLRREVLKATLM